MKPKKYTIIQKVKRLENIVGQMYYSFEIVKKDLELIKKRLDKKEEK